VEQIRQLPSPTLILMIGAGVLFLLYGRSLFRGLVMINAMIFGAWLGWRLGGSTQYPYIITIGLAMVLGILAWPMFKLAVAGSSGMMGAMMVWQVVNLHERLVHYGPVFLVIGFIVFAILGWVLFRAMIIVVTAVQGAGMILLSLVFLLQRAGFFRESSWIQVDRPGAVHLAVLILAAVGILYQVRFAGGKGRDKNG
jgi:hypothetical protein